METILISLPIFLIIFFGWLFSKTKILNKNFTQALNKFAYYIGLPALIISSFWKIDFSQQATWKLVFESSLIILIFSALIFFILSFLKIDKTTKTTILLGSIVGNTVFIGFPLVNLNFGEKYLNQAALVSSFFIIIPIILLIFYIQSNHKKEGSSLRAELFNVLKNPLFLSILFGIFFSFLKNEIKIFNEIEKTIALLGSTASPVALFALGSFLHGQSKQNFKYSMLISFLKMIFFPIVTILLAFYVFKNNDLRVVTLLSSMPVAVTTFVIAEKFNLNKELIGDSILISTIFSFLISPIIISIFL